MSKYAVTTGIQNAPVKTVLYGPEGIGKSTFASYFPDPVFIDTEGGTKRLNVKRLPQPTSWTMLLDEVAEVRKGSVPCGTLVIDTADWAERLCIQAVCAKAKVNGIEDFGYGKGYTYVKEEFGKLLDALEEVLQAGHNVVVLAHAAITKFEQPDAVGNYDRWSMKTSKQVAPLLREWCDMLLFANYKTVVKRWATARTPRARPAAAGVYCTPRITPAGMPKTALTCRRKYPLTMPALPPASPALCLHRHRNRNRSRVPSRKPTSCPARSRKQSRWLSRSPHRCRKAPRKMFCSVWACRKSWPL